LFFYLFGFQIPESGLDKLNTSNSINVMSANLAGLDKTTKWVSRALRNTDIDFAGFQETSKSMGEKLKPQNWNVHCGSSLCLLSKHSMELVNIEKRDFPVNLYKINLYGKDEYLLNIHLETPRKAYTNFNLSTPFASFTKNVNKRYHEAQQVKLLIMKYKPAIVVGDFNMPTESSIYQENFSSMNNAFNVAGVGLGHTKFTSTYGVRIDHILTSDNYLPTKTWVYTDVGSDHHPIISNIAIR